jgi:phenylacetate-coenzyme A ligase PaaK-like adenylate-forming protein
MDSHGILQGIWADVQKRMPEHVSRLTWSREQVREYQTKALRELLTTAKQNTKYYKEALKSVDTERFNIEDLPSLPPHDKIVQMERWDDFIAAPGITYEIAEKHLEGLRSGSIKNPFYNDRYLFIATGGSTGKRGLFLWDMHFIKEIICYTYRCLINDELKNGYDGAMKLATVEAPTLLHGSPYVFPSKPLPQFELLSLASTDPIPGQCEKLNEFQPTYFMAYASSVAELASAQLRGELNISPRWVCTTSGPQDEDIRDR